MTKRQSDKNKTKQVRMDSGIHKLLKVEAARSGRSLKSLLEGFAAEGLGVINEK